MSSSTITYDEFDELCEASKRIPVRWLPELDEIREMSKIGIEYFLTAIAWVLDEDDLDEDERKRASALNKAVINGISFEEEKSEENEGKVGIPFGKYERIVRLATSTKANPETWKPTVEEVEKNLAPFARYALGSIVLQLHRGKMKADGEATNAMREVARGAFEIEVPKGAVRITKDEYEELLEKVRGLKTERDRWYPTLAELETIASPNFEKCYDFMMWLLETGPEPHSGEDRASVETMRDMLAERLMISDRKEMIWS